MAHGPLIFFQFKKIVLSLTTGGTPSFFTGNGIFGDIDVLLWPIHVSFSDIEYVRPCGTAVRQRLYYFKFTLNDSV